MTDQNTPLFSVVIHDVAPATWAACQRVIQAVREVADVPMTLLVVPRYHLRPSDHAFERCMHRQIAKGHELALHGYSHLDEGQPQGWRDHVRRRWYTAGEGEFSALPESAALHKLRAGMNWFERRQWPLQGFVAPAWLLSSGTWQALGQVPLNYTATLNAVYSLPHAARTPSACLAFSTRSLWRRVVSIPRNSVVSSGWHRHRLVRLELHPHDADYPFIRQYWMNALRRLMDERQAVTLSEGVRRLHDPLDARLAQRLPSCP
ncbi:MAG: polysaccharide deacetylase family protein [Aquabacterium sp.]